MILLNKIEKIGKDLGGNQNFCFRCVRFDTITYEILQTILSSIFVYEKYTLLGNQKPQQICL